MEKKLQRLVELELREKEDAARQKFEEERIIEEARKDKRAKEPEAREAKELEALKKLAIEEHDAKILKEKMKKPKMKEEKPKKLMDLTRPTYIKVHRKHLSPATLDAYNLPWEWDEVSNLYR